MLALLRQYRDDEANVAVMPRAPYPIHAGRLLPEGAVGREALRLALARQAQTQTPETEGDREEIVVNADADVDVDENQNQNQNQNQERRFTHPPSSGTERTDDKSHEP